MTQAKTKAGCSIVPLDRQVKREAVMTFEKWFEQYAPTAPEHLDDCAADSWNAAIECAAAICDNRSMQGEGWAAAECAQAIMARMEMPNA